jgi:putative ABC transport system permease protein
MTYWTMIRQSLRFYWRTHLGVILGVAVSTAILVGALVVGDSVRHTLKMLALSRLGKTQLAMASSSRYFREDLAIDMESALKTPTAPVLQMRGIATTGDGTARVNSVQVLGVDERFWELAASKPEFGVFSGDEVIVNERLAEQMGVVEGDDILLRVEKASLLPRDAPMSIGTGFSVALRVTVKGVVGDSEFGRFSLAASQIAPFNAFVPLAWLQGKLGLSDRANMLIAGGEPIYDAGTATETLRKKLELSDANLELRVILEQNALELRTSRIFLDPPVANAAKRAMPGSVGILTYFVNEIRLGDRATPYSIVSALEKGKADRPVVPSDMNDDEVVINTWLAEDLRAEVGDRVEMTYFAFGPMRKLVERKSSFRVRAIVPIEGAAADRELMPVFPGLSEVDNCRDWEPGVPINLSSIRKKDEEYWDLYRGTPKAFVTLEAGQRMWGNRFGNLTALRYPLQASSKDEVEAAIVKELDPASVGLVFLPVREQALAASTQSMDFGQLFLGLSLFLMVAALLLTGLLFVFGIEQRSEEVGTLLAMGFTPRRVRRLLLLEGGILALTGGILGVGAGILYTKTALYALSTVWRGAVRTADFYYYAKPTTLIIGAAAGVIIALAAIWLTSRRQARRPARELLTNTAGFRSVSVRTGKFLLGLLISVFSGIAALVILTMAGAGTDARAAGAFFGAGALLLICCLGLAYTFLTRYVSGFGHEGLTGMGLRNSARRRGRSLATIGLLACGSFLIIAVGANRHDSTKDAEKRSSGTGGFAFYGEIALPVLHDLNGPDGRKVYDLDTGILESVKFIPFRVRDGEDASCLNLNRPQNPRLMGVRPEYLLESGAFTFNETLDGSSNGWSLLEDSESDNVVNAIGDQNTISWAVGKSVGDKLLYTDERGQTFYIRIAGAIANSILQGSFIISEDEFVKRFPSESGYRTFLIDAPSENTTEVSKTLTLALQDVGLDLTPAVKRLGDFNTVQNTYLSIFQSLGGLALLLGSIGLGIVVLRNVMERRSELAILRAVGFRRDSVHRLILSEHWFLLVLGLICGVASGLISVIPALRSPGAEIPYASLTVTLLAILFSGALWTWIAARLALRGQLLSALRDE